MSNKKPNALTLYLQGYLAEEDCTAMYNPPSYFSVWLTTFIVLCILMVGFLQPGLDGILILCIDSFLMFFGLVPMIADLLDTRERYKKAVVAYEAAVKAHKCEEMLKATTKVFDEA